MDISQIKYKPEMVVSVSSGAGKSYFDLNPSISKDFFITPILLVGVHNEKFNSIPSADYCVETYLVGLGLSSFLSTYAESGRKTIARSVWRLLSFQANNDFNIGGFNGLEAFCHSLKNEVQQRVISERTASGILANCNSFLKHHGSIVRKYQYQFSNNSMYGKNYFKWGGYYTTEEFAHLMQFVQKLYGAYAEAINQILENIENGKMPEYFIFDASSRLQKPISIKIRGKIVNYELTLSHFVNTWQKLSVVLFTFYTLIRRTQLLELKLSDIVNIEGGGIDSVPVFKGRAFKFVRYGIGASEFEMERVGLRWFEEYLKIRKSLLTTLSSLESVESSTEYLFFRLATSRLFGSPVFIERVNISSFKSIYDQKHTWKLSELGFELPHINLSWIIKSAEMLLDDEKQNPVLTSNKSQHEWDTYVDNYGRGNPISNLKQMTNALSILSSGAQVEATDFDERKNRASKQNLNLIKSNESGYHINANGFGCNKKEPTTSYEKNFLRKANQNGYKPKQCMDLLNCLNCDKCAVIDDSDAVYEVLSLRQAILLNKPIYRGSKIAEDSYQDLVSKIDRAMTFVDAENLLKAQKKINREGISEIWRIKI